MLSLVKILLKGEVGGCALDTHGNYIGDHGKSWKYHEIVFLNFCGNPELLVLYVYFRTYLDRLAEEVNDKLQEEGHVTIPELTKLYDLPGEYLAEVSMHINPRN